MDRQLDGVLQQETLVYLAPPPPPSSSFSPGLYVLFPGGLSKTLAIANACGRGKQWEPAKILTVGTRCI